MQYIVEFVNEVRHKAICIATSIGYHAFLHVHLYIYQCPIEFLLYSVSELGRLPEAPLPLLVALVDLHELVDPLQITDTQHAFLGHPRLRLPPLLPEGACEGLREHLMGDHGDALFEVHHTADHTVDTFGLEFGFVRAQIAVKGLQVKV